MLHTGLPHQRELHVHMAAHIEKHDRQDTERPRLVFLLVSANDVGGTEQAAIRQTSYLRQSYDIEIVSIYESAPQWPADVYEALTFHFLTSHSASDADEAKAEASAALTGYLEQLHSEDIHAIISMSPVFLKPLAQFYTGEACVIHQEHRMSELRGGSLKVLQDFGPACDHIVVLSPQTKAALSRLLGLAAPHIAVIPNGIDREDFRTLPETPTITFAGRLVETKQCSHALRAFRLVLDQVPKAQMLICGDGIKRPELEAYVDEDDRLKGAVRFLGVTDMSRIWPQTSLGILSSNDTSEAFPLVILEANARGIPYAAYDCCHGVGTMIEHGKTGMIIEQDNIHDLADAMAKLLNDGTELTRMSQAAHDKVREFSTDRVMAMHTALFSQRSNKHIASAKQFLARLMPRRKNIYAQRSLSSRLGLLRSRLRFVGKPWRKSWLFANAPIEDVEPADARNANATLVRSAAEAGKIDLGCKPQDDDQTTRFTIARNDRKHLIANLKQLAGDQPVYIEPMFSPSTFGPSNHVLTFSESHYTRPTRGYRIYRRYANESGTKTYRGQFGAVVEIK